MILLLDNYDSFVFNLERYLIELGCSTKVVRNDAMTVDEIARAAPQAIILSPGPCGPAEAGISVELIQRLGPAVPMLGVCLGHQCLAAAFGGQVVRAPEPVHGRVSWIRHTGTPLFQQIANPFTATRYHSLIAEAETLPDELQAIAWTDDKLVMALQHRDHRLWGVQFHPESILTEFGHQLLANFLSCAGVGPVTIPSSERDRTLSEELPETQGPPPSTPMRY